MEQASKLRASFYRDGKFDKIMISIVGDPNTVVRKVTPEDIDRWPMEWQAYQRGAEQVDVGGTALVDVPGITPHMALTMRLKGVRNVEELAALDDAAVKVVGFNAFSFRESARNLLAARELAELKAQRKRSKPAPVEAPAGEAAA